jgi:uncharacterized membrane protein YeaQ/YmgE (transglycosylase-associated protein family)
MTIVWMILVGLFVGIVARFVMPGAQSMGLLMTSLLGIGGSFVAGVLGQAIGWYKAGQGPGFIGSVVGALLVLWIVGRLKKSNS